ATHHYPPPRRARPASPELPARAPLRLREDAPALERRDQPRVGARRGTLHAPEPADLPVRQGVQLAALDGAKRKTGDVVGAVSRPLHHRLGQPPLAVLE